MIEYCYGGVDQGIRVIGFTKTQHLTKAPMVKIHVEAGRQALSVTLTPAKTRELIEELIETLWDAEDGS